MRKFPKFLRIILVIQFLLGMIYIPSGAWLICHNLASNLFIAIFWSYLFVPYFLGGVIVSEWVKKRLL